MLGVRTYKSKLSRLLQDSNLSHKDSQNLIESLNPIESAHFFVDVAFLISALRFIEDEHWIQNQKKVSEILFSKFIKKFFKVELAPVLFLHSFLESSSLKELVQARKNSTLLETAVVQNVKTRPRSAQKEFTTVTLQLMSELFEFEHQLNLKKNEEGLDVRLSLYRTFDIVDQILELNYLTDEALTAASKTERLYEGGGVGVQSSYASALTALRYLNPLRGSRLIDLGSGYGRVCLAIGLLRPDLDVIGYEFVAARVKIATAASANLGIDQHVHFHTQDLSAKDFKIPVAESYYIFDSFSDESYKYILDRLIEIASQKKITVVTKGNARLWFQNINWSKPQEFNFGNLCLFRSR